MGERRNNIPALAATGDSQNAGVGDGSVDRIADAAVDPPAGVAAMQAHTRTIGTIDLGDVVPSVGDAVDIDVVVHVGIEAHADGATGTVAQVGVAPEVRDLDVGEVHAGGGDAGCGFCLCRLLLGDFGLCLGLGGCSLGVAGLFLGLFEFFLQSLPQFGMK